MLTSNPGVTPNSSSRRAGNVSCKISGMVTEADWHDWRTEDFSPYLDVVHDALGGERVMFGSDWPVCPVAATYESALGSVTAWAARLPEEERLPIFGANAARVYGIR